MKQHYNVYFLNPDGSQIMRTEKVGDHEAHDFTAVSYEVDSTHKLVGWAAKKNGTENIADKITVPKGSTSVNVYAIIKEGYWVTFDSDGGSIVDSQFVLHGDNLVLDKSTTPTKPGYTFDGWYNGLTKVENGATVTSPMTLTAHWKAAKVSYTVIHWWENADDDGYSFHESQELQGLTGATTTAAAKSYTIKGKNIHGKDTSDKVFTATTIEQKTIKGDGSTIVNVYYKRKTYTMHFKERSYSRTDYTTITKKWGQSISKKEWPTYNGNGNWQISDSRYLAYTSTMPMNDSTLWSTSGYYTHKAYYYVRNIEDTNYELHHTDVIKSSSDYLTIGKEDCYAIAGFTYSYGDPGVDGYYNNSKFYYTRNSYKIKFINKGKVDKSVDKKYQQSISNENYTPTRPSSLLEYYVFDGWYENELCEGEAFDFSGKKMPAQNVTLYAKWTAKKISLKYNLNNPEGTVDKGTTKVAAGTIASTVLPSASAIEGYSFAGWYVADENGHMTNVAFNANDAILKDTNVIGKWLYNGELKVKYVADGVEAPKDNNVYAGGAKATVANGVTKEGKKFLGWQLDGNVYQPGQNFEVNKNLADDKNVITLTAVFGDSETSAILNYHPGNGNGEDQSVAILNNVEVALESTSNLHYSAPGEDYYFAGWATSMEDAQKGNAKYAVGDKVRVNADSSNDLYATWVKKTVIEVTANSNTLPYNGEEQKVEGFKVVTAGYEVTGLKAEAKGTNFGTYDTVITDTATVTKGGVDVTDKVIVNVTKGTLTISKRDVTLTSGSASRVYNKEALTNGEVTVSGDGFAKNEGATYTVTGSQTEVGESDNTFTYELKSNTKASNYNITKKEGKLSITPVTDEVTVTIKGNSKTTPYNGTVQSVSGYTVESISNTLYTSTDFTLNGQAMATGKDAATYPMNLSATQFVNNNTNFSNVKFEIAEDGQLVINPRAVTLTSETASKDYDGTPLTRPNVKIEGNFVDGEVTEVKATGSVTYVSEGDVTNTIVITKGENFKESNYSITKHEGTLSITEVDAEVTVTIKGHEETATYDGNPHSVEGYEITDISNKLYTKDDVKFTGQAKAEGTEAGTYQMHLTKDQFSNKNSNFKNVTFVVEDGSLIINRKSIDDQNRITVTKPSDSKYNGEEHRNKPIVTDTKTNRTLVEGTDYELSYSDDVTNAGTVTVTVKGIGNYSGETTTTYQITKRNVTLTSGSASRVYNKEALTNGEVTVSGEGFAKDEGATYTVTGSRIKVGSSKNTFTYELKENTKASNYNIEVKFGDLIVTAEDGEVVVTITGRSDTVDYDGNEKTVSGYDVTITEGSKYTTDDFTFNGTAEAKGTEAGTYPMNLAADQFTNTNDNYTQVTFIVNDGTLTINPKSITPDGPDTPKEEKTGITVTDPINSTYDGNEHINGLTVTDSKLNTTLVEGTDYTLTYSGDLINVGTVTITIKGIGNYTGEFTKTYQILPREYTVTTNTDSKVYDGTALTAGGTVNNLVDGETVGFTMTGSQTNVGTSNNTYELNWTGSAKESNYKHGKDSIGTLTVTKQSIAPDPEHPETYKEVTITSPSDEVYDGKEHKWIPTVTDKEENELVAKTDYEVTYSTTDFTNVTGTITVTITGIGNYTGKATRTYSITPKTYTVTTESDSKVYDGTALTAGGKVSGIVKGETVDFTITGSQTSVGTSDNTYELDWTGSAKESNYKHGKDSIGTLTVTAKSINPDDEKTGITVTDPEGSKYDGEEHKNKPKVEDTKTKATLKEGKDYELSYSEDVTNAGTVTVTVTGIGNYEGSFEVTYEITKRHVTLTSADDEKVYDGSALTNDTVTVGGDKFAKKEGATYNVTGMQIEKGSSKNTFTYTLNEGTLAGNYNIETFEGTLKVTAFENEVVVTIKGNKGTVTYDGNPHSVEGYEVTNISNELYKKDYVGFTGEAKAEGTKAGTYKMNLTAQQFSNTSASFDKVTFKVEDGALTISPKSITPDGPDTPDEKKTGITVTAPEDSKYDGEEHRNKPTVTDTKTKATLKEGTDYELSYSKDVINAGTVTVIVKGIGNYEGSFEVTYEITKRNVTLTSGSASKVYDKTALTNDTVTVSGEGFAKDEGATYKVTGSRTKVGTSKNTFTYELKSNTKASNYNIEVKFGELKVTAQDGEVVVTITGHSDSVDYDGNEKSVSGYDVAITEGSKYTTDDFTFNGNAEAKGTEAGTYPMNLAADQFTNTNDNYTQVTFIVNDGTLTINPKSITPDGPDTPKEEKTGITVTDPINSTYDGNEHINGLTVTDSKLNTTLVEGTDYTLTYSGDLINVGTVTITIKGIGNYTGEFTKTYQILPREYTVTTNTDSKVYDGTALTAGGTVNNLVDGETVGFTMTGSQTNVGTSNNTYELNWTGSAKESNYKHGKDSIGTLTVTKQSIAPDPEHPETYKEVTITSPSDEVYDGKEHKWIPTVTDKEENELVAKTDYEVTYSTTDFTNVTGTITVTITGIGNYTGKATRTYSITPKTYTVTTESDSKVYDGTALTAGGKVSGIVKGETVDFTITGSQTSVGTSDNTYELDWTGSAKESNYKHGKDSIGTLTVKAKSIVPDGPDTPDEKKTGITVSDPSDSKYDGKEHREVLTVQDTKKNDELVAEKDYSVTYSDDLVNAGTVTITIEGIGNYTGSFTKTYEITKRSVTLTSATASKTYDGQALTSTSITVSGDGFVKGEGATYNVTGTQTEVGNSANSFEYKLNENTLASNYDITKVVGTLTVTRDTTPVTPAPTPTTPSVPPVVQRVVPTPTPVPEEKVEEEQTPKAEPKEEEKVEEDYTPKATQEYYWALINLICAIVTVLFGLLLLISKRHKDEDDEEEDDETKQQATTNEDEEQEQEKKRGLFTRVLAVLIAIVSVVFFLVTEDMSLAWTWTDQWTIWMVVIGLVQIVVFFVGRKWKNVDNDDDDEEAQQA